MGLREGEKFQTSHNVHESFSESQQGGTCMIVNEEVVQYVTTQGSDEEGLDRRILTRLAGAGVAKRVITAFIPCKTRKKVITTTTSQ